MHLHHADGLYWLVSTYEERETCKQAGFTWNPHVRRWETRDTYVARKVLSCATPETRAHLEQLIAEHEATKALSRATDIDVELPVPEGRAYRNFQKVGILFATTRQATLIADDMGTGKSIQALGVLNVLPEIQTALIVCPATIKLNWRNEAMVWLVPDLHYDVAVVDTKWKPAQLKAFFSGAPQGARRLAIINYDILHRFCASVEFATAGKKKVTTYRFLDGFLVNYIIVDECQAIKNNDTRQSRAVRGVAAKRKVALSGTPLENRPKELFPVLNYLDPFTWDTFADFATRYCDAHQGPYGWNVDGASHMDELHDRLTSTIMVRRRKEDVLTELPARTQQVIALPANGATRLVHAENTAYTRHKEALIALRAAVELAKADEDEACYRASIQSLKDGVSAYFSDMAHLRHDTAIAKLPQVIAHIHSVLEAEHKVVVLFHHRDVAQALAQEFAAHNPVSLTGAVTSSEKRQAVVERFQTDPTCRVFLGSIRAAGVGITLTAARVLVFAESDWTPGKMDQGAARIDRIGQTQPVLIQYLFFEGSLDATIARTALAKKMVIDTVLDSQAPFTVEELAIPEVPTMDAAPDVQHHATIGVSRAQVEHEAAGITPEEVARVHEALRYLAGVCDFASSKDHAGFNMVDAHIGHALADQATLSPRQAVLGQKILKKYHRQLEGSYV